MSVEHLLQEKTPMVVSQDDTAGLDIDSMLTGGPVIFPQHHYNSNYSAAVTAITLQPEHPHHSLQASLEEHSIVQPNMLDTELCINTEYASRSSSPWKGSLMHPLTLPGSIDHDLNTCTMLPPYYPQYFPPPSAIPAELLQAQVFQPPPAYHIDGISSAFPSQISSTGCPGSVFQNAPPKSFSHSQTQDPGVPNTDRVSESAPGGPQYSSNAAFAPVQDNLQFSEPGTSNSAIHAQSSEDAENAFAKLIPFLQRAHARNFGRVLSPVLKETHDHVSLDDVFCMLYSGDTIQGIDIPQGESPEMNHCSQQRLAGIKLQLLLRESFRNPETFHNGVFQHSSLASVKFHEFVRSFLAMKILYGCIKQVDDSSQTLPRLSVYKVYYILCQKLIRAHPDLASCVSSPHHHFLGQPKIGILTNIIYPDLVWKRLGKRGHSKVHYVGFTWNDSMVDKDTLGLLDLDVTELSEYFERQKKPLKKEPVSRTSKPKKGHIKTHQKITPIPMLSPIKPFSSFVDLSCKYPDSDCSPRIWKMTPNTVPKKSEWAKITMERSVAVLKGQGINLEPLITKINTGNFVDEHSSITTSVIQSIKVLSDVSSSKEMYLHLYLAVILLLLPVIIASDQEVPKVSRAQLRASMKDCVMKLENEVAMFESIDHVSLTFFSRSLRKMIHINEMGSCDVKQFDSKIVLKEMIGDFQSIANSVDDSGFSACEVLFISATIKAMNAFSLDISESSVTHSRMSDITNIHNIGKSFQYVSLLAMRTLVSKLSCIQADMTQKDVGYQIFHLSAKLFHQVTLSCPEISQLPIPIITFIILYFTNEMQQVSFAAFARRDPDLSQETFKSWWIFSSMFQEYMGVISEVVALSQMLV